LYSNLGEPSGQDKQQQQKIIIGPAEVVVCLFASRCWIASKLGEWSDDEVNMDGHNMGTQK
jgi:hypothetical protein